MPLQPHLKTLIDYNTVSDSVLLQAIDRTAKLVANQSRSDDNRSNYEALQLAQHVITKIPTERLLDLYKLTTDNNTEARLLLTDSDNLIAVSDILIELKGKLGTVILLGMHMHYLTETKIKLLRKSFTDIAALKPSLATRMGLAVLYTLMSSGDLIPSDSATYREIIEDHWNVAEYTAEFRDNLFLQTFKDPRYIYNFTIIDDYKTSTIDLARLVASLIEDSPSAMGYIRYVDECVSTINLAVASLVLEEHFKSAELPPEAKVDNITQIIRKFSSSKFNAALSLVSRLTVVDETTKQTAKNIMEMYSACTNTSSYYNYYSSSAAEQLELSLYNQKDLCNQISLYKNISKLNKGREFTINTVNTGFVTQGKLTDVIKIYKSRYWVEYVFFLRGFVGTLTDDEVYWALTHTTNSNIQQGAMLFMRTMMGYHVKEATQYTFKDLTATKAVMTTVAQEDRVALSRTLEDNYPLSYSMYAVFAEV